MKNYFIFRLEIFLFFILLLISINILAFMGNSPVVIQVIFNSIATVYLGCILQLKLFYDPEKK